ncbi:MAG TPA: hypothetical protein VN610_12205 [Bryobacteraceae bacterium]|nr:hypothetical protein [Bryobacteraceae bacterium]
MERVAKWVQRFDDYGQLDVALSDILARLTSGTKAEKFEQALDEIAPTIGFVGKRPDKEWKEGPDNLWAIDAKQYLLWECKRSGRKTVGYRQKEAEQMNRSSAWFDKHYQGIDVKPIIIPSAHLRRFHPFGRGDAGERTKTVRHAYKRVLHVV